MVVKAISGGFHLFAGHIGNVEAAPGRPDLLPGHTGVGGKLLLLLQKLRHLLIAEPVYIVGGVLSGLMKHYHVGNGKAVSLEVCGVVDVEAGENIVQRHIRRKGRGIDQVIIRRVNGKPRRLQAVVRLKTEVPRFVPAL